MAFGTRFLLTVGVISSLGICLAQTKTPQFYDEKNWKQVCARAVSQPFTAPVSAGAASDKCDALALYYGFGHPSDPAAALSCALYQRRHDEPPHGDPFSGPGILTMLYANGVGVPRNYDLAIRFACEIVSAADAEMSSRVGRLEHLRDTHTIEPFDLCADATSGLMGGACASIAEQRREAKRQQDLNGITASWSQAEKEAFRPLQAAHEDFVRARSRYEVDHSGTARGAFEIEEQGLLRDQFLINLRHFAAREAPQVNGQADDRQLNDVYKKLQQQPADFWQSHGTIKPEGIRDTERVWVKLRDQWVAFGRLAYPNLTSDRITTELTLLRLHQLRSLLK